MISFICLLVVCSFVVYAAEDNEKRVPGSEDGPSSSTYSVSEGEKAVKDIEDETADEENENEGEQGGADGEDSVGGADSNEGESEGEMEGGMNDDGGGSDAEEELNESEGQEGEADAKCESNDDEDKQVGGKYSQEKYDEGARESDLDGSENVRSRIRIKRVTDLHDYSDEFSDEYSPFGIDYVIDYFPWD